MTSCVVDDCYGNVFGSGAGCCAKVNLHCVLCEISKAKLSKALDVIPGNSIVRQEVTGFHNSC